MGINSGPVDEIMDVNERSNLAGAGITMAQRVMDCGDAGHILLSKRSADDLAQYGRWRPHLHELGQCEVKHGVRLDIVNFHSGEAGNPALPDKLKKAKEVTATLKSRGLLGVMLGAAILLLVLGVWFLSHVVTRNRLLHPVRNELPFCRSNPAAGKSRSGSSWEWQIPLIAKLSNSREIIVSSLNSVRKFVSIEQDSLAAGRELQVNSVLTYCPRAGI
jgi:hypothetical protein